VSEDSGTACLEEAVAAYRDAMQERTRQRVPLQWAYSEHGLANALAAIAVRSNDPAHLEEAIRCMNGAAEIYRGPRQPMAAGGRESECDNEGGIGQDEEPRPAWPDY
jgi:hypothetical protein